MTKPLDLGADRALRREARGGQPSLVLDDDMTILLPAELPLDVFAPLEEMNLDVAYLIKAAFDAWRAGGKDEELLAVLIDLLITMPQLPGELLSAIRAMGRLLLGSDGYEALIAFRPSREDYAAIVRYLLTEYGVSPGEVSPPPGSSESGGQTSEPTSSASTGSTPDGSTPTPETPTTSDSAT